MLWVLFVERTMLPLLWILVATAAILIVFYTFFIHRDPGFPPGPRGLPFLGYYPFITFKRNYIMLMELAEKYGSVVGVYLGPYKVILVNGWEAVREALHNDSIAGRPDLCILSDRFNGKNLGIGFVDGEFWKAQRRFTLFHFRNLGFGKKAHAAVIMEEVEALRNEILEIKEPFSLEEPIMMSVVNVMWALLGGERFNRKDPKLGRLIHFIERVASPVTVTGNPAVAFPFLRYLFPNWLGYNVIKSNSRGILAFIKGSIAQHKANGFEDPTDFIGLYLNEIYSIPDAHFSFTEEQLEALCLDLLVAATETSTASMVYTILHLALNEECQTKAQEEIDRVLGQDRLPTLEDRNNLVYVDACITETLRVRTPAPVVVPHKSTQDTTLQGYKVPVDTGLLINIYSVLMDSTYWKDPHTFRPERFISEDGKLLKEERLIAFGKGKRSCLGESLAKMASFLTVTSLLQKFSFTLPPNEPLPDMNGRLGFTLNPPYCKIMATSRVKTL